METGAVEEKPDRREIVMAALYVVCGIVLLTVVANVIHEFHDIVVLSNQPADVAVRIDGIVRVLAYGPDKVMVYARRGDALEARILQTTAMKKEPAPPVRIMTDAPAGHAGWAEAMGCRYGCAGTDDAYASVTLHIHDVGEIGGIGPAGSGR